MTAKRTKLTGLQAAHRVLTEAGREMTAREIVEAMLVAKTWKTKGKTPAATIYVAITRDIAANGDGSRFRAGAGKGTFVAA